MEAGSPRGHGKAHQGGKPAGSRVKLPRGSQDPIKVYINGHEQKLGLDYKLVDGFIVFKSPIVKEDLSDLPFFRKLVLGLGLVGSYQRDETVDVEYHLGADRHFASDLPIVPDKT